MTPNFCNLSMRHASLWDIQEKIHKLAQERDLGFHHCHCFHLHINRTEGIKLSGIFHGKWGQYKEKLGKTMMIETLNM